MQDLDSIDFAEEDAYKKLIEQLERYDDIFKQKYAKQTPNELADLYAQDQTKIPVPEEGSEIEQYLRTTFIADNRQFGHYQNLMRQARVPEYVPPPPPPPPKIIEDNFLTEFIPIAQNFQEQNANSKQYAQVSLKKQKNAAVMDNGYDVFHLNQIGIIKAMQPPPDVPPTAEQDFNQKLQENIDKLGGFPNTINGMIWF